MLPRVLEPEVMDTREEAHDYDAMDHAAVNRVFVADFLAIWDGHNPILDVGTGTAQIPIELCRQATTAQVVAVDMAPEMLRRGGGERPPGRPRRTPAIGTGRRQVARLCGAYVCGGHLQQYRPPHPRAETGAVLAEMVRVVQARRHAMLVRVTCLRPDDEIAAVQRHGGQRTPGTPTRISSRCSRIRCARH